MREAAFAELRDGDVAAAVDAACALVHDVTVRP
jgi:hypothetical protein